MSGTPVGVSAGSFTRIRLLASLFTRRRVPRITLVVRQVRVSILQQEPRVHN